MSHPPLLKPSAFGAVLLLGHVCSPTAKLRCSHKGLRGADDARDGGKSDAAHGVDMRDIEVKLEGLGDP